MRGEPVTYEWLVGELARWRFMPGWEFTVRRPFAAGGGFPMYGHVAEIVITATVRDARRPDDPSPIRITSRVLVPDYFTRDYFPTFWHDAVTAAALHEADEWLQRDGVVMFDPHTRDRVRR